LVLLGCVSCAASAWGATLTLTQKQSDFQIQKEHVTRNVSLSGDRNDSYYGFAVTGREGAVEIAIPVDRNGQAEFMTTTAGRAVPISFDCDYSSGAQTRGKISVRYRHPRNLYAQVSGDIEAVCVPLTPEEIQEQKDRAQAAREELAKARGAALSEQMGRQQGDRRKGEDAAGSSARSSSADWNIATDPQPGNNLRKVCLANQDGRWVELNAETPANCTEMLVAERDSHWLWPDRSFYEKKRSSRLFRVKDTYNLGLIFDVTSAASQALSEAGAFARLDQESAAGVKNPAQAECEKAYESVKTLDQLSALESRCRGYAASRTAYSRILGAEDLAKKRKAEADAAQSRPNCSKVEFSGIVVGSAGDLEPLTAARDKDDIIARHPLSCGPNGFTQLYACRGAAWFTRHTGYIVAWTQKAYQVATPIDLIRGRKDALVYINRKDTVCRDNTKPSNDFAENWKSFLLNHNENR
jgi:hypothetical protein